MNLKTTQRGRPRTLQLFVTAVGLLVSTQSQAQLAIPWSTIDGGGGMNATGGVYTLGGTIGQHDAGPGAGLMTGGHFTLAGGFWMTSAPQSCSCPGDMNADGKLDGADVQEFVNCLVAGDNCPCADMNGVNGVTVDDAAEFVQALVDGIACP